MTTENVVYIDFNTQPSIEVAGTLLVSLLYSEPRDTDDVRSHALTVLGARALHARAAKDAEWANSIAPNRPCYTVQSVDAINRGLVDINRRLRRRWIAGEMALPLLEIVDTGRCRAMEHFREKPTINKLAGRFLNRGSQNSIEDIKKRIWSPSKPVLHLAAAFSLEKYTLFKNGEDFDFDAFLWDSVLVARLISIAELYERLVEKGISSKMLNVDPTTLIRVRATAA